jgi:hypothetical protein
MTIALTYDEFSSKVSHINGEIRYHSGPTPYGRTLSHALKFYRPELAARLEGTPLDPMNKEGSDIKTETWEFLQRNW